ncbi:MAG TPA: glycosyltransferase family 9 protein [Terrimicrobiaceae bacterium]
MAPPKTLLLIKPGSFGDIIHAIPCAAALKEFLPDTRITWLVDERWEPLLTDNPAIDKTVTFPREKFRGIAGMLRSVPWALRLEHIRPDVALDLQGLLRSALMARLSRARRSVGMADAREGARWLYDDLTPVRRGEHSVLRYLRILEALGLPKVANPVFPLPPGTPVDASLQNLTFILLHPFARGEGKSLSQAYVAEFCSAIRPMTVVLAGVGTIQVDLPDNAINLLNRTTIRQMIWLVGAAAFVVSVDSGPMHIAAAINPRMLSIHTWSDPRLVGPFSHKAWIWQGGEIRRQQLGAHSMPSARSPGSRDILQMAEFARQIVEKGESAA